MTKQDRNRTTHRPDGDDPREAILSRRARFVGLALASAGVVVGCEPSRPLTCLSPPALPPTAATTTDEPGDIDNTDKPGEPDGGTVRADAGDGGGDSSPPRPCLTPRRNPDDRPGPSACLSVERPPDPKGVAPKQPRSNVCLTLDPSDD